MSQLLCHSRTHSLISTITELANADFHLSAHQPTSTISSISRRKILRRKERHHHPVQSSQKPLLSLSTNFIPLHPLLLLRKTPLQHPLKRWLSNPPRAQRQTVIWTLKPRYLYMFDIHTATVVSKSSKTPLMEMGNSAFLLDRTTGLPLPASLKENVG